MSVPSGYTKLGTIGYSDKGDYSSATTYSYMNVVHYNGNVYFSKQDNNTNNLPTNTSWWGVMIQGGATDMTGATSSTDGVHGLVPAPLAGDEDKVLKGDGTWGSVADMTGATSSNNGTHGLVPQPKAGDNNKFLSGDGTYKKAGEAGDYLELVSLGTEYTSEIKNDIASGEFKIAKVGRYLTINGHKYYFAHANYWYGSAVYHTNHMVVIPASPLLPDDMSVLSQSASDGYYGSDFETGNNSKTTKTDLYNIIKTDFGGASNLLEINYTVSSSVSSSGEIISYRGPNLAKVHKIVLPSIYEVFGVTMPTAGGYTDITVRSQMGKSSTQLELFRRRPDLIAIEDVPSTEALWWLRNPYTVNAFMYIRGTDFVCYDYDPSSVYDFAHYRPIFAIG